MAGTRGATGDSNVQTGECGRSGRWYRVAYRLAWGASCLALAGCANSNVNVASRTGADHGVAANAAPTDERAAKKTVHRTQKPAAASTRASQQSVHFSSVGVASWYGADFHGRRTANGEIFDMNSLTAAHPTLPLSSHVRVTNLANHRSLVVRVNDRGPYVGQRVIDVSAKTAQLLGFYENGLAKVKVEVLGRAPSPAAEQVTASAATP